MACIFKTHSRWNLKVRCWFNPFGYYYIIIHWCGNHNPNAIKYNEISYDEVREKELGVMDIESIMMAKKHNIPIIINKLENALLEDIINNNAGSIIK